jgi:elongation factor Ts
MEKAIEQLRKQGAAVAAKRVSKEAKEGRILLAVQNSKAVAVEVNSETDFVSNADDFKNFSQTVLTSALDASVKDLDSLKAFKVDGKSITDINLELVAKIGENIGIRRMVAENFGAGEFVDFYSHNGGKIGVLVKLAYTGTLADTQVLSPAAKDVAMQIAALAPVAVRPEDVDAEVLNKEKEIYRETTLKEGKQGPVVDKIVEGKVQKFFKENCLLQQLFVKDSKSTVEKYLADTAKANNLDSLTVVSFHRLQLGA